MQKHIDTLTLGAQTYRRSGWFWVPMTSDDFAALDAAEDRRDNLAWAITFALAGAAFTLALVKNALF